MEFKPPTDAEIKKAEQRARERDLTAPRITAATFSAATGLISLAFLDGQTLTTAARAIPGLENATDEQLADIAPAERGHALFFDELDEQYSTVGLLRFIFKLPSPADHARKAGRARTEKKAASSRANGAKGGRPRRPKEVGALTSSPSAI